MNTAICGEKILILIEKEEGRERMIANFIIGGLIVCGAVLALRFMIRRPKGKGCCGSCSGCSGCMAGKTEKK